MSRILFVTNGIPGWMEEVKIDGSYIQKQHYIGYKCFRDLNLSFLEQCCKNVFDMYVLDTSIGSLKDLTKYFIDKPTFITFSFPIDSNSLYFNVSRIITYSPLNRPAADLMNQLNITLKNYFDICDGRLIVSNNCSATLFAKQFKTVLKQLTASGHEHEFFDYPPGAWFDVYFSHNFRLTKYIKFLNFNEDIVVESDKVSEDNRSSNHRERHIEILRNRITHNTTVRYNGIEIPNLTRTDIKILDKLPNGQNDADDYSTFYYKCYKHYPDKILTPSTTKQYKKLNKDINVALGKIADFAKLERKQLGVPGIRDNYYIKAYVTKRNIGK